MYRLGLSACNCLLCICLGGFQARPDTGGVHSWTQYGNNIIVIMIITVIIVITRSKGGFQEKLMATPSFPVLQHLERTLLCTQGFGATHSSDAQSWSCES